jgi:DNA-cytosine methyltransferase
MSKLRLLDLFSGIGGASLGLHRTGGFRTVAFCEIEPFPRKVLKKNFPGIPIFKDVRELHAEDLPEPVDVIWGSYPCQPFSVAGKQRGEDDDRHLWPEVIRLVRECKPELVLCENVAGHIQLGLDTVLSDLESEGYTTETFIIPACAVNAIHRRDRLWIMAYSRDSGRGNSEQRDTRKNGEGRKEGFRAYNADEAPGSSTPHRAMAATKHNGEPTLQEPRGEGQAIYHNTGGENKAGELAGVCVSSDVADTDSLRAQGVKERKRHEGVWKEPINKQLAGLCRTYLDKSRQPQAKRGICQGDDGLSGGMVRRLEEPTEQPVILKGDCLKDNAAMLKAYGNTVIPQIVEMLGYAVLAQLTPTTPH